MCEAEAQTYLVHRVRQVRVAAGQAARKQPLRREAGANEWPRITLGQLLTDRSEEEAARGSP
jgi:hypothetical protein